MTTYSEIKGNEPINWFEELNKKNIDWDYLRTLGNKWVTCACGNQCDIIPRNNIGQPLDLKLANLGLKFADAISFKLKSEALSILIKIEKRSTELIKD